jgi:hypothetical protein
MSVARELIRSNPIKQYPDEGMGHLPSSEVSTIEPKAYPRRVRGEMAIFSLPRRQTAFPSYVIDMADVRAYKDGFSRGNTRLLPPTYAHFKRINEYHDAEFQKTEAARVESTNRKLEIVDQEVIEWSLEGGFAVLDVRVKGKIPGHDSYKGYQGKETLIRREVYFRHPDGKGGTEIRIFDMRPDARKSESQ